MMDIGSALERWARLGPETAALLDENSNRWTRRAFRDRVVKFGNAMSGLGLVRGDRIAILDGRTRRHLEADYGAMAAGFVRVPLDPMLKQPELEAQLRDSGARVLVCAGEQADMAERLGQDNPDLIVVGSNSAMLEYETLLATAGTDAPHPVDLDALAALNYTGGTTSAPKAVMLTHRNLSTVISNVLRDRPVHDGDQFLNVRPLWPISALSILIQLLGGAHVELARFDPDTFGMTIAEKHITATSLVPAQIVRLLDAGLDRKAYESLRVIDVGAAAIAPDIFLTVIDEIGPRIGVLYGLTEAPWTSYLPPSEFVDLKRREERVRSIGTEVNGYQVRILDSDGNMLPPGQTGEIVISGAHVMAGYWQRPDLTKDVLPGPGTFMSGDLGHRDINGNLYVVGRKKEVIRSGGKSILPQEVEHVLLTHPDVRDAAVLGEPHREWGEMVKAFVVLRSGSSTTPSDIIRHCKSLLPSFKCPKQVEMVDALPKSHYGKVMKRNLGQSRH